MKILEIAVALVCAYGLFVTVSWMLMRLLFPKIEIEETDERQITQTRMRPERRVNRTIKRQKNLAY